MAVVKSKMTEEDFMALPDDGYKYELVGGEARAVPANFEHDVIGAHIISLLMPWARGRGFVAGAQAGFRMRSGNIRCPDVSFTLKTRLPDGKPVKWFADFAPDLCVEIISLSEDRADMRRKVEEYFDAGAQQIWHLFPEERKVTVYTSPADARTLDPGDNIDAGSLLPGFRCRVEALFILE